MGTSIRANETPDGSHKTHKARDTLAAPATAIGEFCEHVLGRADISHDPENDEVGEKGQDVEYKDNAFSKRKLVRQEDVEAKGDEQESEKQKTDLPECSKVRIRVVNKNKAFDLIGEELCAGRNARNPTEPTAPSDHVGQWLLKRWRCEFTDPVVLCVKLVLGERIDKEFAKLRT